MAFCVVKPWLDTAQGVGNARAAAHILWSYHIPRSSILDRAAATAISRFLAAAGSAVLFRPHQRVEVWRWILLSFCRQGYGDAGVRMGHTARCCARPDWTPPLHWARPRDEGKKYEEQEEVWRTSTCTADAPCQVRPPLAKAMSAGSSVLWWCFLTEGPLGCCNYGNTTWTVGFLSSGIQPKNSPGGMME